MKVIIINESQYRRILSEEEEIQSPGIKGVIFDFDFTLFDTDDVLEARRVAMHTKGTPKQKALAWEEAYKTVGKCKLYPGIRELLEYLNKNGIPCCVVSMCKPEYVTRTLAAFGLPQMQVYGASRPYMPKRKGMGKFIASIGASPEECLSIGDRQSDGAESNSAGVKFLGCSWGQGHDADAITNGLKSPLDVIKYIGI